MKRQINAGVGHSRSEFIPLPTLRVESVHYAAMASIYCELAMVPKLEKDALQLVVLAIFWLGRVADGYYLVEKDNCMYSIKKVAV